MEEVSLAGGKGRRWGIPVAGAVVCLALGLASGWMMQQGGGDWYEGLEKPPGTPPAWVFGPVWTVLYLAMGVAAGRLVVRRAGKAVTLFIVQLALNLAWTPVFFGAQRMLAALGIIALLGLVLAWTVREAEGRDRVAAWLLLPYLLWVCYATYLNAGIAWLNR